MPVIKLRGLPWSCVPDDISRFLQGVKIVKIPKERDLNFKIENEQNNSDLLKPAIHLMTNSDGRPSGEAFIELEDENDLEQAIKKNNALMGQRYIEVFRSNYDQLNKHLEESENNTTNWRDPVVRLRGLPYGCTKQEISTFFDGLIIAPDGIMMVIDFTGRFNGEAFVKFDNLLEANKALDRHKQKISNRYIEVFRSTFDEMTFYSNNSNTANFKKGFENNNNDNSKFSRNKRKNTRNGSRSSSLNEYSNNRHKPYSRNESNSYRDRRNNSNNSSSRNNLKPLMSRFNRNNNYNNNNNNNDNYDNYNNNRRNNYNNNMGDYDENENENNYDDNFNDDYEENNYNEDYNRYNQNNDEDNSNYDSTYVCENNHRHYLGSNRDNNYNNNNNYNDRRNGRNNRNSGRGRHNDNCDNYNRTCFGLKMRGLPYSANENDINQFFSPLVPADIIFLNGNDRRPSGECEVDFSNENDLNEALKYDKKYIGNRYIELFILPGSKASESSKTSKNVISFGSLMNKDFSGNQTNGNSNNLFTNFDSYNIRENSSSEGLGAGSSGVPPPPPPPSIQPLISNITSMPPGLSTSSIVDSIGASYSTNLNEILMAEMAQKMFASAYNAYQQQSQQLHQQQNQTQQQQSIRSNNNYQRRF